MEKNRVKEYRKKKGLSQFDLARLSNVDPSNLSKIENEKIIVYPGWKERISKALNEDVKTLFPEEGDD